MEKTGNARSDLEVFPHEEIWRQCVCLGRWVTSLRAGLCPCIFMTALGTEVIGL